MPFPVYCGGLQSPEGPSSGRVFFAPCSIGRECVCNPVFEGNQMFAQGGCDMDWKEERNKVLAECKRVVVKVGSAVLTDSHGLSIAVVDDLAEQISRLHDRGLDVVLVSSGAVAAGRGVLGSEGASGIGGMPDRQAASAVGQSRLMHAYDQAFEKRGKITAQILLTKDDLQSRRRFLNARNTFSTLLKWRVIPVINENDTVVVRELEFGDNDHLAGLLLNPVEADIFVNLTSAEGVYAENPDSCPGAACLPCIDDIDRLDIKRICGEKTLVGSGGMYSKLLAAKRAAQLGVPTLIVSGRKKHALLRAFEGEDFGTWIIPESRRLSGRKYWLAYNVEPSGVLTVDRGAVKALSGGGKSLLPAGITDVQGNFGRGALVRIIGPDDDVVGVGFCNYKAADLRKILGKKSGEIEGILGPGLYAEAVHCDNLVIDPALYE